MSNLVTVGINHASASLAVREQLAVPESVQQVWVNQLLAQPDISEAIVLSTCNRTELYCLSQDIPQLTRWLAKQSLLTVDEILPHIYTHQADDMVRHAIRVASGLDSMILGEPQIFGQMKQAVNTAQSTGGLGPTLQQVFRHVFNTAKRIRSELDINKNPTSVAYAAVKLLTQHIPDLSKQRVLLIGTGNTTHLVAKYLATAGVANFYMANRTLAHAQQFAQAYQGTALSITDINNKLDKIDIVVTATACPLPFITPAMLASSRPNPLYLIDLAVPRDVDPSVAELDNIFLYNIDDLQRVIKANLSERRNASSEAESIIADAVEDFIRLQAANRANSTISRYRESMETLRAAEATRALHQLTQGQDPADVITELSHRLMNKITHQPSRQIRKACIHGQENLLRSIETLYES